MTIKAGRTGWALSGLLAGLLALMALAAPAEAGKKLKVGFADDKFADNLFTNESFAVREKWFERASKANAELVRINVYWSNVARSEPKVQKNPDDPAYDWAEIDRAVRSATAEGLDPVLLVWNAPRWAEGKNRPSLNKVRGGSWKPEPGAFGKFGEAIARRYDGGDQPRVRYYEAWNEGNLVRYIAPLWKGKKPFAAIHYRKMLNKFYDGVKAVNRKNKVITGGTSPFGEPRRLGTKMYPLYFWRKVLCMKGRKKVRPAKGCSKKQRPRFDVLATNAINGLGEMPTKRSSNPDDLRPADFGKLRKLLRKAEKAGHAGGAKRHQLWSTETWYESKPPDKKGLPLKKHAKAMVKSLKVLSKKGAQAVIFLQLRDSPYDPKSPSLIGFQTGIYFHNEKPKPAAKAIRFPFSAKRRSGRTVKVWGKAPAAGKVRIERKRGSRWKPLRTVRANSSGLFESKVRTGGGAKLRASYGGRESFRWKVAGP